MFKKKKRPNKRTRLVENIETQEKRQKVGEDGEEKLEIKKVNTLFFIYHGLIFILQTIRNNNELFTHSTKNRKKPVIESAQQYKANRELTNAYQHVDGDESDDINNKPNQEAFELEIKRIQITNAIKNGEIDSKVYRGQKGYATYFDQTEESLKRKQFNGTLGPTKNDNYMKSTSRIDRNPELCKDFFETGHCAFGDTCIFIHDRTDYASGHQIEEDWNNKQRKLHRKLMGKKFKDASDSETDEEDNISTKIEEVDDEGLPLKCKICNGYFKEPIITSCGHYFCENCAFKHHGLDKTCYTCHKPTQGIFNIASKITKKLSKMSPSELKRYREQFGNDDNRSNHDDENHAESTAACCSHGHHKHSHKPKPHMTETEKEEELMNEFIDKQKKIRENNYKATAGGWIIP